MSALGTTWKSHVAAHEAENCSEVDLLNHAVKREKPARSGHQDAVVRFIALLGVILASFSDLITCRIFR